jgi:tripartite-type tricarboxylate transporter receptor subunit TctC
LLARLAFGFALLAGAALAAAQGFPSRTVKITMPHSSGVAPSIFMRLVAEKLGAAWGRQVVVENRPGASGFIAIEAVKGAPRDGHELLAVANSHMTINPSLYRKLPYDPEADFAPVAMVLRAWFFVTVATNGPYQSVPAIIAAAKANPGHIIYSSSYVGSPSHLGAAEFEYLTGTRMVHVPYKDQSQMYIGIANGDIHWAFSTIGSALPLIKAGRIKVIALAARQRIASAPEIPTVEEAGGPAGFEIDSWIGLVAPRGTPPEVVRKINADVNRLMADPEVLERMKLFGFEPAPMTPDEIAAVIRADTLKNAATVRRTGASAE